MERGPQQMLKEEMSMLAVDSMMVDNFVVVVEAAEKMAVLELLVAGLVLDQLWPLCLQHLWEAELSAVWIVHSLAKAAFEVHLFRLQEVADLGEAFALDLVEVDHFRVDWSLEVDPGLDNPEDPLVGKVVDMVFEKRLQAVDHSFREQYCLFDHSCWEEHHSRHNQ